MPSKKMFSIVDINKPMVFMCLCKQHLGNEKIEGSTTFNPNNLSFNEM
jgi:glutaminase